MVWMAVSQQTTRWLGPFVDKLLIRFRSRTRDTESELYYPFPELPQYGSDQSSRDGGQHVRTISYETPQEPTSLLLSVFDVHGDHSMNLFFLCKVVDDAKLVEAMTVAKYWKVVIVG